MTRRRWPSLLLLWVSAALAATVVPVAVLATAGAGTAAAATACPCSLFAPTAVPTTVEFPDTHAVELGVQFQSSIPGSIVGVRFYKGPDNTGAHVGSLWSSSGTLLAQATFTSETATGWQQVTFSSPVSITPGTTYVASYHTNTGYYSYDGGFYTNGYANPPLSAPSDASGTPNGVFAYSPVPVFQTGTYNGNNYWVDVVLAAAPTGLQIGVPQASPPKGTSEQLTATESYSDGRVPMPPPGSPGPRPTLPTRCPRAACSVPAQGDRRQLAQRLTA